MEWMDPVVDRSPCSAFACILNGDDFAALRIDPDKAVRKAVARISLHLHPEPEGSPGAGRRLNPGDAGIRQGYPGGMDCLRRWSRVIAGS